MGLSAGTVITEETKEPNNRVLLGALLFGFIVSFVLRNLCLSTYRRNLSWVFLQVPSSQKKQRNQTIEFAWELYCLVVLFLLFYVICASVPTEGTPGYIPQVMITDHCMFY